MREPTPENSLLAETLLRPRGTWFIVMKTQNNNSKADLLDLSYVVFAIDTKGFESDGFAEVYPFINIRETSTARWNTGCTFYIGLR